MTDLEREQRRWENRQKIIGAAEKLGAVVIEPAGPVGFETRHGGWSRKVVVTQPYLPPAIGGLKGAADDPGAF